MLGWLYLIKNGDLYKIGITKNFDNRMRQLKPDYVVAKLYSNYFRQLERVLHKRYKNVRIPQTEYFRLEPNQVREIKHIISKCNYNWSVFLGIFINTILLLLALLFLLFIFISLIINDMNKVVFVSLLLMERISFFLSIFSIFLESGKYLSLLNQIKFRLTRFLILFICAFLFRFASGILF